MMTTDGDRTAQNIGGGYLSFGEKQMQQLLSGLSYTNSMIGGILPNSLMTPINDIVTQKGGGELSSYE